MISVSCDKCQKCFAVFPDEADKSTPCPFCKDSVPVPAAKRRGSSTVRPAVVSFVCPSCGKRLRADIRHVDGREVRCAKCHEPIYLEDKQPLPQSNGPGASFGLAVLGYLLIKLLPHLFPSVPAPVWVIGFCALIGIAAIVLGVWMFRHVGKLAFASYLFAPLLLGIWAIYASRGDKDERALAQPSATAAPPPSAVSASAPAKPPLTAAASIAPGPGSVTLATPPLTSSAASQRDFARRQRILDGKEDGEVTLNHEDRRRERGRLVSGLKQGLWATWEPNNDWFVVTDYQRGKKDGFSVILIDFKAHSVTSYRNDLQDGFVLTFRKDGSINEVIQTKNDEKHGLYYVPQGYEEDPLKKGERRLTEREKAILSHERWVIYAHNKQLELHAGSPPSSALPIIKECLDRSEEPIATTIAFAKSIAHRDVEEEAAAKSTRSRGLTGENFLRIKPGMSKQEVTDLLGQPTSVETQGNGPRQAEFLTWADGDRQIVVGFLQGVVTMTKEGKPFRFQKGLE